MTANMPTDMTVTVIIPTYNRSPLLAEAVESVLAQTFRVHEIVIVDDGSDDEHQRALTAIASRSPVIRVHQLLGNQGRSQARNAGLAAATGELVLFLDDDDLIHPALVESAVRCFATGTPADVVAGCGQFIGNVPAPHAAPISPFWIAASSSPERIRSWCGAATRLREELQSRSTRTLLMHTIPINAFVVRRSAIGLTRFAAGVDSGEDWMFWLDLTTKGCRFRFNSDGLAYVRLHAGQSRMQAPGSVAQECVAERVKGLGREEEFLAAAHWFYQCWSQGTINWRRMATLLRFPGLLISYGGQILARRTYRLWLRATSITRSRERHAPLVVGVARLE